MLIEKKCLQMFYCGHRLILKIITIIFVLICVYLCKSVAKNNQEKGEIIER